jgi:hypothetical protein
VTDQSRLMLEEQASGWERGVSGFGLRPSLYGLASSQAVTRYRNVLADTSGLPKPPVPRGERARALTVDGYAPLRTRQERHATMPGTAEKLRCLRTAAESPL